MKIDDEGNVIPEPVGPDDPGLRKRYVVGDPVSGIEQEYWFTDQDVASIMTQFQNYQMQKKEAFYPT